MPRRRLSLIVNDTLSEDLSFAFATSRNKSRPDLTIYDTANGAEDTKPERESTPPPPPPSPVSWRTRGSYFEEQMGKASQRVQA